MFKPIMTQQRTRTILIFSLMFLISMTAYPAEILVGAASSLTDVFKEIVPLYESAHPGTKVRMNLAASGVLQQQIENGAPIDIFISAADKQMNALAAKDLVITDTRFIWLQNQIVMSVPLSSPITRWDQITGEKVQKIAIGNPATVPAGQYAQSALSTLNLWIPIQSKLVMGENVRQCLAYIENSDVDAGFIFYTDAKTSHHLKIVPAPANFKQPAIVYPAAIVKATKELETAQSFISFLKREPSLSTLKKAGFIVSSPAVAAPNQLRIKSKTKSKSAE